MRWSVIVPVKALPAGKSRLVAATTDAGEHARLVRAIRRDTCAAVGAVPAVARLILVSDRPDPQTADALVGDAALSRIAVCSITQHRDGLNSAVADAATHAATCWPDDAIAALVGDLPALCGSDLAAALATAARLRRGFVRDAAGTGTTLLTARPGIALCPEFGAGSAQRHARCATEIEADARLRCDVDTPADLGGALALGLTSATAAALTHLSGEHR